MQAAFCKIAKIPCLVVDCSFTKNYVIYCSFIHTYSVNIGLGLGLVLVLVLFWHI